MQKTPLTPRQALVLQELVATYLENAEAVSSQAVALGLKRRGQPLSSATVRGIMADLEGFRLLEKTHTSSGRIPTQDGVRLYVQELIEPKPLSVSETGIFYSQLDRNCDVRTMLQDTSRLLSQVSQYAGIVVTPRTAPVLIKRVEFVQMGSRRVMGILIAKNGMVFSRAWDCGDRLTLRDLEKMTDYCNKLFFGLSVEEAIAKAGAELSEARAVYDTVVAHTLEMATQICEASHEGDVIVDAPWGHAGSDQMMTALQVVREKRRLLSLVEPLGEAGAVHITVGADHPEDPWYHCGSVTAAYTEGSRVAGYVGVLGPTRMDYPRVVPIVRSAAQFLGQWLAR